MRSTRRLLVTMEEPGSPQDCAICANHEISYNAIDIVDCQCVVPGWQSTPDTLWDVKQNYAVKKSDAGSRPSLAWRPNLMSRLISPVRRAQRQIRQVIFDRLSKGTRQQTLAVLI